MNLGTNDIANHNEHLFHDSPFEWQAVDEKHAGDARSKRDDKARRAGTASGSDSGHAADGVPVRAESESVRSSGLQDQHKRHDAIADIADSIVPNTGAQLNRKRAGIAKVAQSVSDAIVRLRDAGRIKDREEPASIYERARATARKLRHATGNTGGDPDAAFHYEDPLLNRVVRRDHTLFIRRAKAKGILYFRKYSGFMKSTAAAMAFVFLYNVIAPAAELAAQPFQDYEEDARTDVQTYIDRASRLEDEDAWNNYVNLGVATEFIEWEEDAAEKLRDEFNRIGESSLTDEDQAAERASAEALYEAARLEWEANAEEQILSARGEYLADQADLEVGTITDEEYAAIRAEAEAAVLGEQELNLDLWDATVAAVKAEFDSRFEDELDARLDQARTDNANLTPEEQAEFDRALAERESEIRREFEMRDHFYLLSARNTYQSLLREDDVSARLLAESESATAIGDDILDDTIASVSADTDQLLDEANQSIEEISSGADSDIDLSQLTGDWESKMEAIIDAGLHKWELAEEDLYKRRLQWMEDTKRSREEAEVVWQNNHEQLKDARDQWLEDVQERITEGRELWEAKFAEFNESKRQAELELQRYVEEERLRRDATLQQLGDMVRGGGAALGEAKEAYYYYDGLMGALASGGFSDPRDEQLYYFYRDQRDSMYEGMVDFQRILAGVEGTLETNMHSDSNSTGMLTDVRLYAGTLPQEIEALDEDDFETNLREHMAAQSEDYVLYQRDLFTLIDRNKLFVQGVDDLQNESAYEFTQPDTLEELTEITNNLDEKYDEHKREILAIIARERKGIPEDDDAAKLAAIKADIEAWFDDSSDVDARLKRETVAFFDEGLFGYYLTGNENDPYLMTKAELEWELLRRERNYLAKRLQRAEAVKRYADLAAEHEAGLEMASITEERADIAKVRADLREIAYLLIKGDIEIDPAAATDAAVRDAEYQRVLGERGLADDFLEVREDRLLVETALTQSVTDTADQPDETQIEDWVADIDAFLLANVPEEDRDRHRLGAVRSKLVDFREQLQTGTDALVLANRWNVIRSSVETLDRELDQLLVDYDFDGFRAEFDDLRDYFGEPDLGDMRAGIYDLREDIQQNAEELAESRAVLEVAKEKYRNARIDFDILNSADSADLIRFDVTNTTKQLAGILNRMSEIEAIDGMPDRLYDAVSKTRAELLIEVSQNQRARDDLAFADEIYEDVQGLEAAKTRLATVDEIIADQNVNSVADPVALADLFIDEKTLIIDSESSNESFRSFAQSRDAMSALESAKANYEEARTELDDAIAAGDKEPHEIAILEAQLEDSEFSIRLAIEKLITATRGEERARRELVMHLLEMDGAQTPEALEEAITTEEDARADRSYDISETAAVRYRDFISANREKSFAELLDLLNTQLNALQRNIRTNLDGYSHDPAASEEYEIWSLVRDRVVRYKPDIDYNNQVPEADSYDQRTVSEKWDVMVSRADDLAEDASFFRDFNDSIPDSNTAAWVSDYRDERTALMTRLDDVLSNSDADILAAYNAMTTEDRALLVSYEVIVDDSGADLRGSLNRVRRQMNYDLLGFETNYRAIYLREKALESEQTLSFIEEEIADVDLKLREAKSERAVLERDLAMLLVRIAGESDAAIIAKLEERQADLEARIAILNDRVAILEPQLNAKRDDYRQASNILREIERPGSTSLLAGRALQMTESEATGLQMMDWTAQQIRRRAAQREFESQSLQEKFQNEDFGRTTEEQIKAIIGFFETDASGQIVRDASGAGLISQEFLDIGAVNPDEDLLELIGGDRSGVELERWSQRLIDVLENPERARRLPPEVLMAADQLRGAMEDLKAARLFIESRYLSAEAMREQALAEEEAVQGLSQKLTLVVQLEDKLRAAIDDARANEQNPADFILAEIERPENQHIWDLFRGYSATGEWDGIENADLQARINELLVLANRLRTARKQNTIAGVADRWGEYLDEYLSNYAIDPYFAGNTPDPENFVAAFPQLKSQAVRDAISGLDPDTADFRDLVWTTITNLDEETYLYSGELIQVLQTSTLDGADLKTALLDSIDQTETDLNDGITALMGEPAQNMLRDRDLEVETSVTDLIAEYAVRGTNARATYAPQIADIDDGMAIGDAQFEARQKMSTILEGPQFASIRIDLIPIIDAATDTPTLKTRIQDYLNTVADPPADDLAELEDELYNRELAIALQIASMADTFDPGDYPEELHEFVLIYQYSLANQRYESFLEQRASDIKAVREAAALDLRGLMGDYVREILARDYAEFQTTNDPATYIEENEGRRSVEDYAGEYFQTRGSSPLLMPDGGAYIYERIAHDEYRRLAADATAAGGLYNLNEQDYFADFRSYILLAVVDDYIARAGFTFTGATIEDRRAEFRTIFAEILDDATYEQDGQLLRERLLSSDVQTRFFDLAFSRLEEATPHEKYLPLYLEERRIDGTLLEDPKTSAEFLPDELLAITDYDSLDYREIARNIAAGEYGDNLALIETLNTLDEQIATGAFEIAYESALLATDADLDRVIAAAGHATIAGDARAHVRSVLLSNIRARYMQANGVGQGQAGVDAAQAAELGITVDERATRGTAADYRAQITTLLREEKVLRQLLPNVADRDGLEAFYVKEGARLDNIEAKFFAKLFESDGRLHTLAREERGVFLGALIDRSQTTPSPYYDALDAEVQTAFDELVTDLFTDVDGFDAEQKAALIANAQNYETAFDLRSAQELVTSGIFEAIDNALFAGIERAGDDALLADAKANRAQYLKGFIDALSVVEARDIPIQDESYADIEAALTNDVSAETQALFGAQPALLANFARNIQSMAPELRRIVKDEQTLVERFAANFVEADNERALLIEIMDDPALIDPSVTRGRRYVTNKLLIEYAATIDDTTSALVTTVDDHARFFNREAESIAIRAEAAGMLKAHADLFETRENADALGATEIKHDLLASRFASYRTYIGTERQYQEVEFTNYDETREAGDPVLTFEEYSGGLVLEAESLDLNAETLFDANDWEAQLRSDEYHNVRDVQLGKTTPGDPTDDEVIQVRRVRRVSSPAQRNFGNDYDHELRYTYHEHLANNYIEAISNMNAVLNGVFMGTNIADARIAEKPQDSFKERFEDYTYDVLAAGGENNLEAFLLEKQDAQARLAAHGTTNIQQRQKAIDDTLGSRDQAATDYAQAARRNQARTMGLVDFINRVYSRVATEMEEAQLEVRRISAEAEGLQDEYAAANQTLVNGMNEMAKRYRDFEEANDKYELEQAVQDWAETPYLYQSGSETENETLEDHAADAATEYERAYQLVEQANQRLKQAVFNVQTEDKLAEFNAIVEGLDEGLTYPPLSDDEFQRLAELRQKKHWEYEELTIEEEDELMSLTQREMYQRYEDLILARADHIKHSMRMIRLHKANEIVNAEILRLRGIVAEKKQKFDRELNARFSMNSSDAEDIRARNAVYMRLASQVEAGAPNFFGEFRAWYWNSPGWLEDFGNAGLAALKAGGLLQITQSQISEGVAGLASVHTIPEQDRNNIGRFMNAGGNINEYNNFSGNYFQLLTAMGQTDLAKIEANVTKIAMAIQIALGTVMTYMGLSIMASGLPLLVMGAINLGIGLGLLAGIITAPAAPPPLLASALQFAAGAALVATGASLMSSGIQMITTAIQKILLAEMKVQLMQFMQMIALGNSINAAGTDSTRRVMEKQEEYEEAKAELEYFTKIPDMQTMKERMVEYGRQHSDNDSAEDLWNLTDEDLKYLFDQRNGAANYIDHDGNPQTLSDEEKEEALDLTNQKDRVKYQDSFGRAYDPATLTEAYPGPLVNGVYGDGYTRVRGIRHNGTPYFRYAKLLPAAEWDNEYQAYNMGEILKLSVQHGQEMRDERRAAYLAEGNRVAQMNQDARFTFEERDQTADYLFDAAGGHAEGGREYTGYRMVFEDYESNQRDVFNAELGQRVQLQLKEWELREAELNDRYNQWEKKMQTILDRGREQWSGAESKYLQEWRDWERQFDREEQEGEDAWDAKITQHMQNKQDWELNIREQASEATIQNVLNGAVDTLNSQIRSASLGLEMDFETINKQAAINDAIQQMKDSMPQKADRLKELNRNIDRFKTQLSVSELTGSNSLAGVATVAGEFRNEMKKHQKKMEVKARVQMYEEYRKMIENFKFQVNVQNEAVENQTTRAATSAGYVRAGDLFVKKVRHLNTTATVNAYTYYDVNTAVDNAMSAMGFVNLHGDALFDFLEEQDTVEVEAFFYTQKLAAQRVFEKILGTARDEDERDAARRTRNVEKMGEFSNWVGQGPDTDAIEVATAASGNSFGADLEARNWLIYSQVGDGFGELGSTGVRPGGAPLGFYLQLKIFEQQIGQEQAESGLALTGGTDLGTAIGGQFAQAGKAGLQAAAAGAAVYVTAATGQVWAGAAVSAAMTYAANTIQVDPNTGKTTIKSSDQAAVAGVIAGTTSYLTGSVPGSETGAIVSGAGNRALLSAGTSLVQSGFNYNEDGQLRGFDLNGRRGSAALIRAGLAGAATYASIRPGERLNEVRDEFKVPLRDRVSVDDFLESEGFGATTRFLVKNAGSDYGAGVLGEYLIRQTVGKEYSSFDQASWGSVVGGILGSAVSNAITEPIYEAIKARQIQDEEILAAAAKAAQGKQGSDRNHLVNILAGASEEARRRFLAAYDEATAEAQAKQAQYNDLLARHNAAYHRGDIDEADRLMNELRENNLPVAGAEGYRAYIRAAYKREQQERQIEALKKVLTVEAFDGNEALRDAVVLASVTGDQSYMDRYNAAVRNQEYYEFYRGVGYREDINRIYTQMYGNGRDNFGEVDRATSRHKARFNRNRKFTADYVRQLVEDRGWDYADYVRQKQNLFRTGNADVDGPRFARLVTELSSADNAVPEIVNRWEQQNGLERNTVYRHANAYHSQRSSLHGMFSDLKQGATNSLFDSKIMYQKLGRWVQSQFSEQSYSELSTHLNQEIVAHYAPQRERRREMANDFARGDTLSAAAMLGRLDRHLANIETGRMAGFVIEEVGTTIAMGGIGKLAYMGLRGTFAAGRFALRSASLINRGSRTSRTLNAMGTRGVFSTARLGRDGFGRNLTRRLDDAPLFSGGEEAAKVQGWQRTFDAATDMRNVRGLGLNRVKEIARYMKQSEVGRKAWDMIKAGDIEIRINANSSWWDYDTLKHIRPDLDDGIGYTFPNTNRGLVLATASPNNGALARTIIHESVHASGLQLSKRAEFFARAAEIHAMGRKPKLSELRNIYKVAHDPTGVYSGLEPVLYRQAINGIMRHRVY